MNDLMMSILPSAVAACIGGVFTLLGIWLKHRLSTRTGSRWESSSLGGERRRWLLVDVGLGWLALAVVSWLCEALIQPWLRYDHYEIVLGGIGLLLLVAVFLWIGLRMRPFRWRYLGAVALAFWVSMGLLLAYEAFTVVDWLVSLPLFLGEMVLGGTLARWLKPRPRSMLTE